MRTNLHIKRGIGSLIPVFLGSILLGSAMADRNELSLSSCPAPVQAVITSHLQSGILEEVKVITAEGRKLYVADFEQAGNRDLKLHIAEDGTVVTTREDLALVKAPAAVKAAAEKLVPSGGGHIEDVEKEVSNGKTTYLVEIDVKNGTDIKAVIAEDGTVLSQRTD